MPSVHPTIYVARPDIIGLDEDADYADLTEALEISARDATEITILGGFYSPRSLDKLCKTVAKVRRQSCKIRIAVGLDAAGTVTRVWDDMRKLRKRLRKYGFKDVCVVIVLPQPVHFHTKLYRFVHTTRPVWFVGSANPGSLRHELLVKISGRHEGLMQYVDAVFASAMSVENEPPSVKLKTLRDFFLSGVLCHKPPIARLFTFDAFHFDPEHREMLTAALGRSSRVSHANPTTQGFGFDMRSALSLSEPTADEEDNTRSRLQFRPYSVDTVLGWWMPRAYEPEIRRQIRDEERSREARLSEIGAALNSQGGEALVRREMQSHISSMEAYLHENGIDARPVNNREVRFDKFIAARKKSLGDPATIVRLSRTLILTDMPDIWAGETAVEEFEASFFDDLAFRAGGRRQASIVKSIVEWLDDDGLTSGDEFAEAFRAKLESEPWRTRNWL